MKKTLALTKKSLTIIIIIAVLVGVLGGYVWGSGNMFVRCVEEASRFVEIDRGLITEYLHRAGL